MLNKCITLHCIACYVTWHYIVFTCLLCRPGTQLLCHYRCNCYWCTSCVMLLACCVMLFLCQAVLVGREAQLHVAAVSQTDIAECVVAVGVSRSLGVE